MNISSSCSTRIAQRAFHFLGRLLIAFLFFQLGAAHAATQERGFIGGYQYAGMLIADPYIIGKIYCDQDGTSVFTVTEMADPVRNTKPDMRVTCIFPSGFTVGYRLTWNLACPDSPLLYLGDYWALPACAAANKPPAKCPCSTAGNPIDLGSKEKIQEEIDYRGGNGLEFRRVYGSKKVGPGTLKGWSTNFASRLVSIRRSSIKDYAIVSSETQIWNGQQWWPRVDLPLASKDTVTIWRPDGTTIYFASSDQGKNWTADSDVLSSLSVVSDDRGNFVEFQLTAPDRTVEIYNQNGLLTSIKRQSGRRQVLRYSDTATPREIAPGPGFLLSVSTGSRAIQFTYDAKQRLASMIDPAGQVFSYGYDESDNLTTVTYPEGSKRSYLYNEAGFSAVAGNAKGSGLLTGIMDISAAGAGVRFATFTYDSAGNPVSTEHANGVNKYIFDYAKNSITDPLGAVRNYTFQSWNGVRVVTAISQPAGAGSASASRRIDYFDNSFIYVDTDTNGNATSYRYDPVSNLEVLRYEAYRTSAQRTISTEWHPALRLPTRIAAPKLMTTFAYFPNGDLQSKTEQATGDATGAQGFSAALLGAPRTWTYTYNDDGHILTAAGPRTDIPTVRRYTYDADTGDLGSITNPVGQTTRFINYDAHGRAGTVLLPNGSTVTFTYTARGWLDSTTESDGTTSLFTKFDYDDAGNLKTLSRQSDQPLRYSYDAANRLTAIADDAGNAVTFTLDAMGNRIGEQTTDGSGALTRRLLRSFDVLNRLQQITGAVL